MATRKRPSKFASPIDKRPELGPSERGACSEMSHEEIIWDHIHRNALAAQRRGRTKTGGKPRDRYDPSWGYLRRRDGTPEEGEEKAKAKKSEREQVSSYPQVQRDQNYKRPQKRK